MRDMEMVNTSTVCVSKKDNCRNRSPGEFGEQKWVHRTKRVKIMEVEQRYVIKFFSDQGMPGVQIVECLRQYYGEDALSRTQVYFWIKEVKRGERTLTPSQALEESPMKVSRPLSPASSMSILISQPGNRHSSWELQLVPRQNAHVKGCFANYVIWHVISDTKCLIL
jgi:hypothetical protein